MSQWVKVNLQFVIIFLPKFEGKSQKCKQYFSIVPIFIQVSIHTNNINITLYTFKRPSISQNLKKDKTKREGVRREKRWGWEVSADFCYQGGTLDSAIVK